MVTLGCIVLAKCNSTPKGDSFSSPKVEKEVKKIDSLWTLRDSIRTQEILYKSLVDTIPYDSLASYIHSYLKTYEKTN